MMETTSISKTCTSSTTVSTLGGMNFIVMYNRDVCLYNQQIIVYILLPYFTAEAPTCFDSYNQPRLGGGRLFEHAALNRRSAHLSQLAPCCSVAV